MKAFLLAAGLGTRLRPLTDSTPKCLLPIAGRPLLAHWFSLLERHGFTEVLINLHHLPHQVRQFVSAARPAIDVHLFEEPTLLGSAGTVRANRTWVSNGAPFLVAYADNLTNANLRRLVSAHEASAALLTMALFHAPEPERCGIAELDRRGSIVAFEEKPQHPTSDLANAGLYVTDVRLIERIPPQTPADFGRDVLPTLVGEMHGHVVEGEVIDIGTPASYQRAQLSAGRLGVRRPDLAQRAHA